ncbi:cellulose binding domain-containing protein [Sorangium cellulosum]|nr:cellulose binding domain-containing protein [Sorangium cellulosum]
MEALLTLPSDWGSGYCASVTITNRSSTVTTGWSMVVGLNGSTLDHAWVANLTRSDGQLTAANMDWNARLDPGRSTTWGFCGSGSGRPSIVSVEGSGGPIITSSSTSTSSSAGSGGAGGGGGDATTAGTGGDGGGSTSATTSAGAGGDGGGSTSTTTTSAGAGGDGGGSTSATTTSAGTGGDGGGSTSATTTSAGAGGDGGGSTSTTTTSAGAGGDGGGSTSATTTSAGTGGDGGGSTSATTTSAGAGGDGGGSTSTTTTSAGAGGDGGGSTSATTTSAGTGGDGGGSTSATTTSAGAGGEGGAPPGDPACGPDTATFADVRPILERSCANQFCHGNPTTPAGGLDLRLDTAVGSLVNQSANSCSTEHALVVPFMPSSSYLLNKLNDVDLCDPDELAMPPGSPLPAAELKTITDWICAGAPAL